MPSLDDLQKEINAMPGMTCGPDGCTPDPLCADCQIEPAVPGWNYGPYHSDTDTYDGPLLCKSCFFQRQQADGKANIQHICDPDEHCLRPDSPENILLKSMFGGDRL